MVEVLAAGVGGREAKGRRPLILPAMGCHGGGTAEGQIEVLKHLGQTLENWGHPSTTAWRPVVVGEARTARCMPTGPRSRPTTSSSSTGQGTHGVHRRNRVGLLKMAVVGLGRVAGAESCTSRVRIRYSVAIMAIAGFLFQKLPILGVSPFLEDKTNTVRRLEDRAGRSRVRARTRSCLAEARQ